MTHAVAAGSPQPCVCCRGGMSSCKGHKAPGCVLILCLSELTSPTSCAAHTGNELPVPPHALKIMRGCVNKVAAGSPQPCACCRGGMCSCKGHKAPGCDLIVCLSELTSLASCAAHTGNELPVPPEGCPDARGTRPRATF